MASPRKSERLISSRGHGCFTISPPQQPATATRFPSHGSGRPGLVLRTATKLSSVGFEPTAVLTFGLRVRRLNHSATRSLSEGIYSHTTPPLFVDPFKQIVLARASFFLRRFPLIKFIRACEVLMNCDKLKILTCRLIVIAERMS